MTSIRLQINRPLAMSVRTSACAAEKKKKKPTGNHPISRRDGLAKLALLQFSLPALGALLPHVANAAAFGEMPLSPVPPPSAAAPAPQQPQVKSFIARDFLLRYDPATYIVSTDPENLDMARGRPKDNPVRVELKALQGAGRVTVIQQQAAKYKQTLFQVLDITQFGTVDEVAAFMLPPGTRIVSSRVVTIPQAPKDTGTVLGVIERPPITQYRYEALLQGGLHAEVAVGVILGRVLLLGAVVPEAEWEPQGPLLATIADSFRLLPK